MDRNLCNKCHLFEQENTSLYCSECACMILNCKNPIINKFGGQYHGHGLCSYHITYPPKDLQCVFQNCVQIKDQFSQTLCSVHSEKNENKPA